MADFLFFGGLAAGAALLASRALYGRKQTVEAADASGLVPVRDLSHLPEALQRTALWSLAEGGFESRIMHGVLSRGSEDIDVTAFDLETLRERRGEWAWLPVEPPFRIAGTVSIVVCEIDRTFPHVVLKRSGRGDELRDDDAMERAASLSKIVHDSIGMARSHAAELPATLAATPLDVALPAGWRAYGANPDVLHALVAGGLTDVLARSDRRDLVIELLGSLVIVYPAARVVDGADAFADLTTTALALVHGIMQASSRGATGVDAHRL